MLVNFMFVEEPVVRRRSSLLSVKDPDLELVFKTLSSQVGSLQTTVLRRVTIVKDIAPVIVMHLDQLGEAAVIGGLDIIGHGGTGVLSVGSGLRGALLRRSIRSDPTSVSTLDGLQGRFSKSAVVRLLGCQVGRTPAIGWGNNGPQTVLGLAYFLDTTVSAPTNGILVRDFECGGFNDSAHSMITRGAQDSLGSRSPTSTVREFALSDDVPDLTSPDVYGSAFSCRSLRRSALVGLVAKDTRWVDLTGLLAVPDRIVTVDGVPVAGIVLGRFLAVRCRGNLYGAPLALTSLAGFATRVA